MKLHLLFTILVLNCLVTLSLAQKKLPEKPTGKEKYESEWNQVQEFENKGLPRSALDIVEKIFDKAQRSDNFDQYIKALIYKTKYAEMIEENSFEKTILKVESDIKSFKTPLNAIVHSVLAEMYWMYYQANRYKFHERTHVAQNQSDDISTWDLKKLTDKVTEHYLLSLRNSENLAKFPISDFDDMLRRGNQPEKLRPGLYDFLAFRAIAYFSNSQVTLTQPADKFVLTEDFYFANSKTFVNTKISTNDTLSLQFNAIRIYQDLLRFRLKENNTEALCDAELSRFEFVYNKSANVKKDSLYFDALQKMLVQYKNSTFSAEISYVIANLYFRQAQQYNPFNEATYKYRYYNTKAVDLCNKAITNYPNSEAAKKCESLLGQIKTKILYFETEKVITPDEAFSIKIRYKNAEEVFIRVASINYNTLQEIKEKIYGKKLFDKLMEISKVVYQKNVKIPGETDYQEHSFEYIMDKLQIGTYFIVISDNKDFIYNDKAVAYDLINSSNISFIQRQFETSDYDFTVLHRKTGKPLQNVKATTWYRIYNNKTSNYEMRSGSTFTSDNEGFIHIPASENDKGKNFSVEFALNNDKITTDSWFYSNYFKPRIPDEEYKAYFFTDRAIYRPGQTVYFKCIVLRKNGEKSEVATSYSTDVEFDDVNRQMITDKVFVTNEFGTFSGSFQIPTGTLNGEMIIRSSDGFISFSVEEYKRPKFEVSFLPFDGNYVLSQNVNVKGKAVSYSGSLLSGASVSYNVIRTATERSWRYKMYYTSDYQVTSGNTNINENGEFEINFLALPDLSIPEDKSQSYNYRITVDVTDINGETQSCSAYIKVGYTALNLDLSIAEIIENTSNIDSIKILTKNFNDKFIPAKGKITIYSLTEPLTTLKNRYWSQPDEFLYTQKDWNETFPGNVYKDENLISKLNKDKLVAETEFNTAISKSLDKKNISILNSGSYVAEMKSIDAFGNEVTTKKYFTIYSKTDKKPPVITTDWFNTIINEGKPGEKAMFSVGSSEKEMYIIYEVEHNKQIIFKNILALNNEMKNIEVPILKDYEGNFSVHFTAVKNNRIFKHDILISVPYESHKLDIEFETFRDKLEPGTQETWRIKIKGNNGEKLAAEMLASLYDASLDVFRKNSWSFPVFNYLYNSLDWQTSTFSSSSSMPIYIRSDKYRPYRPDTYDVLDWFGFYYGGYRGEFDTYEDMKFTKRTPAMGNAKGIVNNVSSVEDDFADVGFTHDLSLAEVSKPEINAGNKEETDFSTVKYRTNFNETAFFYPQLQTNENGDVIVNFTIPESLTRWKLLSFAHTKDLHYGFAEKELITQKNVMITPNFPRFFREDDDMIISVKIDNLTKEKISGIAQAEFFDATTLKPIDMVFQHNESENFQKSFEIDKQGNTTVKWHIHIPFGLSAITCRIAAKAGNFSDAEENTIITLNNRMLVTETFPLWINGNQTKNFEFSNLLHSNSSTLKNHKLTLEFTSNPAWYAIQALPYLMNSNSENAENAESLFSVYYANSIASYIVNSNPKIKNVFDTWKNLPSSDALLSKLEKNQELKTLVLEQTPWVLEAQNETEQKNRIAILFDLNKMRNETGFTEKKLVDLQLPNGAWSWFSGMPDDRFITQYIISGFGHLENLKVIDINENQRLQYLVSNALQYLDNQITKDYKQLKDEENANLESNHINNEQIQYLYARSMLQKFPLKPNNKEAYNYYLSQAKKYWLENSKYFQAMIALISLRNNDLNTCNEIVKSLKENSIYNEELGMYWKEIVSGFYWYEAPIEAQAIMIELFTEVNDNKSVDELKKWLLKQKQTQNWKTPKATTEAVYALLLKGSDLLSNENAIEINIGKEIVKPASNPDLKVEAGTGYFKTSWTENEIVPEMGKIKVTKSGEGISFGGLYWQYFENLDKIKTAETPLKITKQLFIEKITSHGAELQEINEQTRIKTGDKVIVRIEIKTDRTMNYVHMRDMRAAGFEPVTVLSRYNYQDGLAYYESTHDASTDFYFTNLYKGNYVFEYSLRATVAGNFSNGICNIQCYYAPEFSSHSQGIRVNIE